MNTFLSAGFPQLNKSLSSLENYTTATSKSCSDSLNFALLNSKSQMITSELSPIYPEATRVPLFEMARHVI